MILMNEFNQIIGSDKPTLVDFFATWCGPCKMQAPILEKLKEHMGDKVTIIKIDIDRNQELAMRYRVQSVPTLMIFKNGQPVWREAGLKPEDYLAKKLYEHIPTKSDEVFGNKDAKDTD